MIVEQCSVRNGRQDVTNKKMTLEERKGKKRELGELLKEEHLSKAINANA